MAEEPIKWDEDDPRDVSSLWNHFKLRVKAEKGGKFWSSQAIDVSSNKEIHLEVHETKAAAKKRVSKIVRGLYREGNTPSVET